MRYSPEKLISGPEQKRIHLRLFPIFHTRMPVIAKDAWGTYVGENVVGSECKPSWTHALSPILKTSNFCVPLLIYSISTYSFSNINMMFHSPSPVAVSGVAPVSIVSEDDDDDDGASCCCFAKASFIFLISLKPGPFLEFILWKTFEMLLAKWNPE